jgi:hypothetical protein
MLEEQTLNLNSSSRTKRTVFHTTEFYKFRSGKAICVCADSCSLFGFSCFFYIFNACFSAKPKTVILKLYEVKTLIYCKSEVLE